MGTEGPGQFGKSSENFLVGAGTKAMTSLWLSLFVNRLNAIKPSYTFNVLGCNMLRGREGDALTLDEQDTLRGHS